MSWMPLSYLPGAGCPGMGRGDAGAGRLTVPRVRVAAVWLCTLSISCASAVPAPDGPRPFEERRLLMGTTFRIRLVADDAERAVSAIAGAFDEVRRLELLLSEWRDSSEISEVNRRAGEAVAVGPELYEVLEESIRISEITEGAFDVSFAACGRLWRFDEPRIPQAPELDRCRELVDFRAVELDPDAMTVRLARVGMRIGIAGIGKGYGVDRAAEVLEQSGFTRYIVDGGGDIRISGENVDGPWTVGITHPRQPDRLFGALALERGAIVTSGDYRTYFERAGQRYHSILDPATGRPARDSSGVTVIAATAAEADALATGLFVLGPERALLVAERLEGVEALVIDPALGAHRTGGFPVLLPSAR